MKVINARAMTAAHLESSSVAEDDLYAEWSSEVTYGEGARVIRASTHRRYESVAAGNVGHDPAASPLQWIDIGPTNRWAMFDQAVGTATVGTGSVGVFIVPGAVNALAVIDTDGVKVDVSVTVDGIIVYFRSQSTNVSGGVIDNWYAYFTEEVGRVMVTTFLDLPLYSAGRVNVVVHGADPEGPVSVGTVIAGKLVDLGRTEAGPSIGINDFSRKSTDEFGVTTVVERAWAKRMTTRSMMPTSAVDDVQRKLAALRARPALWIGEEGYDSLTVFGFYKDFSVDLALQSVSYCTLTVEGLI